MSSLAKLSAIILSRTIKKFLTAGKPSANNLKDVKKVLIIRQHNQFGDMLASVSLLRAVRETYPDSSITIIASHQNYFAIEKNQFINKMFVFDKKKLFSFGYLKKLKNILKLKYDLCIVPVTVAISSTSCFLAGLSEAKIKIGPKSLNGVENLNSFVFNKLVDLDWRKYPDAHVSDFILEIVRPFGIRTKNYTSAIYYDELDVSSAKGFIDTFRGNSKNIIGLHVGAGKPQNRWPMEKFIELIKKLLVTFNAAIYFTGSNADSDQLEKLKSEFGNKLGFFVDRKIPELAALISLSTLFITNDTGVMHVAGAVNIPQISLFGPTNPFNWAPLGPNKFFIRKSEFIDDISVEDVSALASYVMVKYSAEV